MQTIPNWDDSLSVGNPEIDEQHKLLVALNQKAAELINLPENATTLREFREVFEEILAVAEVHFAAEERVLALNGCPNLTEHKLEHDKFIQLLANLVYKSMLKDLKNKKIVSLLSEYIQQHFFETDMACREYMREKVPDAPLALG